MTRAALIIALFAASSARAALPSRLALQLGHTTTISMASTVSKVTVADPTKVDIKKQGRTLTLVAREKGTTQATIRTAEGAQTVTIYVAEDKYAMPY